MTQPLEALETPGITQDTRRAMLQFGFPDSSDFVEVAVRPLGWKASAQWTTEVRNVIGRNMKAFKTFDALENVDLAEDSGAQVVMTAAEFLLDKVPEQIFEMLAKHPHLAPHREKMEEYGTRLQIVQALLEVIKMEFPLAELRQTLGPVFGMISSRSPRASGASPTLQPVKPLHLR